MTIWEYLQEPHPWFDTSNYTPLQIGLFTMGALLWIVAYLIVIRFAVRNKTILIPAVAVACNYGCEVAASIFWVPDMGKALVVAYWGWLILDTYILYHLFKYGYKQFTTPFFRANLTKLLLVGIPSSILLFSLFMVQYDLPMGVLANYTANVVMSVAFLGLLFVPHFGEHSALLAWSKFLGTGIISVMFSMKYPDNYFLWVIYFVVAGFDIAFIVLLYRNRRQGTGHEVFAEQAV